MTSFKEKKRIYLFHHYAEVPSYGTSLRHWSLMHYLMDMGFEVKVFASSFVHSIHKNMMAEDNENEFEECIKDGVPFVYIKTRSYSNKICRIMNMIDYYRNLRKTIKKYPKPDLIIGTMPQPLACLCGAQVGQKNNIPFVMEVLDLWPESIVTYGGISENNPIIKCLYGLEKYLYKKAEAIIFSWEGAYDYIINKGWNDAIPKSKVHYVNIGVDLKRYAYDLENNIVRDEDLDDNVFKIVYCGAIRPANDIEILVECAKKLKEKGFEKDIRFLIYGDGPEKGRLEQLSNKYLLDNMKFKGFINKKYIPYVLSRSNLNVLNLKKSSTQQYGNSSNKLFEYFAAGNPVIANIEEGKYPIISKYNCGLVIKEKKLDEYVNSILKLYNMYCSDKEKFNTYRENAKKAAEVFDMAKMNEKFYGIIKSTLKEK